MSTTRRAYNLLRGYINREWDRIKNWEKLDALRELNETTPTQGNPQSPQATSAPNPENSVIYVPEGTTEKQAAAHILGVEEDANFHDIRKAFEKLNKRSNSSNFDSTSEEAKQAADIQKKIHWAYRVMTKDISAAEKRFGSLEID